MRRLFISAYSIDRPPASALIAALRIKGVAVEHTPSNPDDRTDPMWKNWYEEGLVETLKRCDGFEAIIDKTWDASTWMAEECYQAMNSKNASQAKKTYYWNPNNVTVMAGGMVPYLKTELPTELSQAVEALAK